MVLTIKLRVNSKGRDKTHTSKDPENEIVGSTGSSGKDERKTPAHYARARRERLAKDPVAWEKFKEAERLRHRLRRARRTDEQKLRDRETNRIRQQRFTIKLKEEGQDKPVKRQKVLTRSEKEKRKQYNRLKKQESRARMTPQQKRRRREKDAKRKRELRAAKKKKSSKAASQHTPDPSCGASCQGFCSSSAKRMAMSRLWSHIPKDPEKFGEIVEEFLIGSRTTPRKRQVLTRRGLLPNKAMCKKNLKFQELMSNSIRTKILQLEKKKDKSSRRDRRLLVSAYLISKKYRMQTLLSKQLDVRPSYLTKLSKSVDGNDISRKRRSDATPYDVIQNVQSFYKSTKVSREVPYMKTVKNQEPQRIMEVSTAQAYQIWKKENDITQVSLSLFQRLRPQNVLLQRRNRLNQCLCEYCTDITLKLEALNRAATAFKMPDVKIKDSYELMSMSLCPKVQGEKFHKLACINRECEDCGVVQLKQQLRKLNEDYGSTPIHWLKWEETKYEHNGKTKSKRVLTTQRKKVTDLIQELLTETETFAKHLFVAKWQHSMFSLISTIIPQNWIVLVMDFAENYTCVSQNEIQSAHWANEQVTVHPVVAYYNCVECSVTKPHVVQEALVFISNDLVHDFHAVNKFEGTALQFLHGTRSVPFEHVVEFTDGCAAQYKSRGPFADISYACTDFGVEFERNYFGSRHGKGPSDGVSGVVKSAVRRAVVSRRAIVNTAMEMFSFCRENLTLQSCSKQRRTFFFIEKNDIQRDRPNRDVTASVKGTRSFHSVKCVKPGVVGSRPLSCFCERCLKNSTEKCLNGMYTSPWKLEHLKMKQIPHEAGTIEISGDITCEEGSHVDQITVERPTFVQSLPIDVHVDGFINTSDTHVEAEETGSPSPHLSPELVETCLSDLSPELLETCLSMNQLIQSESSESSDNMKGSGQNQELTAIQITEGRLKNKVDIQVGDYVAVIFDDKWFPGEVTEVRGSSTCVNFMEPKGENKFVWPSKKENILVEKHGIFSKLPDPPFPVSTRHLGFDPELYKTITERVSSYLLENK